MNNIEPLEEGPEHFFLESIIISSTMASNSNSTDKTWSLTGYLKNARNNYQLPIDIKVNSGCCVTAIREKLYSNNLRIILSADLRLHGVGQNILKQLGKLILT